MWVAIPSSVRIAATVAEVLQRHPSEKCYGFIADAALQNGSHPFPHESVLRSLEEAAGTQCVAIARERGAAFPLGGIVCLGGDMLRAISVQAELEGCQDRVWQQIADDFGVLREVETGLQDPEANRWFEPDDADIEAFVRWRGSQERVVLSRQIGSMLGRHVATINFRDVRIALCFCARDYQLDLAFVHSVEQSVQAFAEYGAGVYKVMNAGSSHIGKARERLLWNAMKLDPTHIWFADTDMGWDAKLPMRLLASGLDFVGVAGVKKTDRLQFCVNTLPDPQRFHAGSNFLEVAEVGFGFVVMKAEVVHKLCDAYPELAYDRDDGGVEHALFFDMIDDVNGKRQRLSEDLSFCRRWRKIGGQVFVDHESALLHAGRREYTGRLLDVLRPIEDIEAERAAQAAQPRLEAAE